VNLAKIAYALHRCDLKTSVVSVACRHDSFASCGAGEVPFAGSCYSAHFTRKDFAEAGADCASRGATLAEIDRRAEADLLSELLLANAYSAGALAEVWTGGVAETVKTKYRSYSPTPT
jgi:hypothetical protein